MNLKQIIQTAILGTSVLASGCAWNFKHQPSGPDSSLQSTYSNQQLFPRENPNKFQDALNAPYHSNDYNGSRPRK
ncbi:MAG: hypothetical protein AABY01_02620 [Nanoarchaeota archaeon]